MGSDPQFAKWPLLSLSQDIFTLTNGYSTQASCQAALQKVQAAISEHTMAPLYRHLAHPVDGVLNSSGEGSAQKTSATSKRQNSFTKITASQSMVHSLNLPWDEQLYEKLEKKNKEELEAYRKEEEEAAEKAGDVEVQAARGKRAEFWARVGDRVDIKLSWKLICLN